MEGKKVAIVGAGLGGCTLAAILARKGFEVTVFEKNSEIGGRCGSFTLGDAETGKFRFDIGASMILMTDTFDELSRELDEEISHDTLGLKRCEPSSVVHFTEGNQCYSPHRPVGEDHTSKILPHGEGTGVKTEKSFSTTIELSKLLIGSQNAMGLESFIEEGKVFYEVAKNAALSKSYSCFSEVLKPCVLHEVRKLLQVTKKHGILNLYQFALKKFGDMNLAKALSVQSMYMGLSPLDAFSFYSFLVVDELENGIYYPVDKDSTGMLGLPKKLMALARKNGATLKTSSPVLHIEEMIVGQETKPVVVFQAEDKENRTAFDFVVSNADLCYSYQTLLQDTQTTRVLDGMGYGCSTVSLHWAINKSHIFDQSQSHVVHHIFLGSTFGEAFVNIFKERSFPNSLSFYVHIPSHLDKTACPEGKSCLTVLVPVGNEEISGEQLAAIRAMILWRLEKERCGFVAKDIIEEKIITPQIWAQMFNLYKGCALGLNHNVLQLGPFRPANKDPNRPWMYFVGASTQPGCGVPTVIHSAMNTAKLIERDLESNRRSISWFGWSTLQKGIRVLEKFHIIKASGQYTNGNT